jgi:hypothetical protein
VYRLVVPEEVLSGLLGLQPMESSMEEIGSLIDRRVAAIQMGEGMREERWKLRGLLTVDPRFHVEVQDCKFNKVNYQLIKCEPQK